jgi:biotin carboxyl carrier protein
VTIAEVPLVIQPDEETLASVEPPAVGELVRSLPPTADDRSEGRRRVEVVVGGWRFEAVIDDAARAELRDRAARAASDLGSAVHATLRAQIPGRVVRVWVKEGESVDTGQRLLAVEAMKMENEIRAPRAGTVESIAVAVGGLVERGDELVTIGE